MASIKPSVVYTEIHKLATNRATPDQARSRVDQFYQDIAASQLTENELTGYVGKLREILLIASQRHRGAAHSVFQEAINALEPIEAIDSQ